MKNSSVHPDMLARAEAMWEARGLSEESKRKRRIELEMKYSGRCVSCHQPVGDHKLRCASCLKVRNANGRKLRAKWKAEGKCVRCGGSIPNGCGCQCPTCLEYKRRI